MLLFALHNIADTAKLATQLSRHVEKGDVLALRGDLGAGKTAFSRYFIQAFLGEKTEVPSPTFTLLQTYDTPSFSLWHFDLYRLSRAEEALELGIEDAFNEGVSLIEWPEIITTLLPEDWLEITLEAGKTEDERKISFIGHGKWRERLEQFSVQSGERNYA